MTVDSFTTLAANASSLLALLFVLTAVLIWWRTGSTHVLHLRLWRWFVGKQEVDDPVVRRVIAEQSSLMSFRFMTGVAADTLHDAQRISDLAKDGNIPLALIDAAGRYFNPAELTVDAKRLPKPAFQMVKMVCFGVLLLIAMSFCVIIPQRHVLVSLKETGTWLWLSDTSANAFGPALDDRTRRFDVGSCPSGSSTTRVSERDQTILCGIWRDAKAAPVLTEMLREQRLTFALALMPILLGMAMVVLSFRRGRAARRLSEILVLRKAAEVTPAVPG
ncbi:DUF6216 family protein [Lysobacter changpingensis]|uniref:DUF6216 family protein n=1 Tax=Lysobacter changpingensis TaxID=2792784 RepID=UPI001A8C8574|nr:DUF6216 family protein [Lysobacter changpingensis]